MNTLIASLSAVASAKADHHSPITILRQHFSFILIAVALTSGAQAVTPSPDGGYPGGNTAEGRNALFSLTSGGFNTAVGFFSLRSNTTGNFNTAVGAGALLANTGDTAANNTATGAGALLSNTTGGDNTANGAFALSGNTTGNDNTATGVEALPSNTTGSSNVAYGDFTLPHNTAGSDNIALGYRALENTTGSDNIGLGTGAGGNLTTGDSNIDIDNPGIAGESNTIRIGNLNHTRTFIAGITDAVTGGFVLPVLINGEGQLGTISSSRRFKKEIKPMDNASESILALKPVTFQYKSDKTATPQFGLIAEEVAQVNPDLVVRDKSGKIYTVRYDAVNAMLLNEFLKEQNKVQKLEAALARQQTDFQATVAQWTARLDEQAAQIQKVSAQVGIGMPAPKVGLDKP